MSLPEMLLKSESNLGEFLKLFRKRAEMSWSNLLLRSAPTIQQSILVIEVVESKIFEDFQQRFGCNDVVPMLVNAVIFADLRICINNQS